MPGRAFSPPPTRPSSACTSVAEPWTTIVGIVQDGPKTEGMPEVYLPYTQYGAHGPNQELSWFLLARAAGDPKATAPALQQAVGQEFRNLEEWLTAE